MKWKDEEHERFTLRLPATLHEKIKKKLTKYYFQPSMNDYIIKCLLKTMDQDIPF